MYIVYKMPKYATKSSLPKYKYLNKFDPTDKDYIKEKNKLYYEKIKNDPHKSKSSLVSYYKRKYGEHMVLNMIETFGLDNALEQLRDLKYEMKKQKQENPLLKINCY